MISIAHRDLAEGSITGLACPRCPALLQPTPGGDALDGLAGHLATVHGADLAVALSS